MQNNQNNNSNNLIDTVVDTKQMERPLAQEQQTAAQKVQNDFLDRFKYVPLYILAVLPWVLAARTGHLSNGLDVIATLSIPFAFILVSQKKKFENKWIYHTLLAFIFAPLLGVTFTMLLIVFAFL